MTLTLRRRILLTVAPLVLLLAGLGTAGAGLVLRLGRLSDAILRENHDSVRAMERLREGVYRVDRSFLTGSRSEYDAGWAEIDRHLAVEKGNVTIFPDEPRMFAYAYSVIDTQLMHGTRVAIPGLAFQNEPGWYLDLGMDAPTSVNDDWFSVASLIKAGR